LHHTQASLAQLPGGLVQNLSLQFLPFGRAGADHEGQQALRAAELAAIEHELGWRLRAIAQGDHGCREWASRALRVDGGNGFVTQAFSGRNPGRRVDVCAAHQACGFPCWAGKHDLVELFAVNLPAIGSALQRLHAPAEMQLRALPCQPVACRVWQEAAEVDAGQQQVGAAAFGKQCVMQYAQEHLAARLRHGCVERGNAQWLDELLHHALREAGAQLGHGAMGVASKARAAPGHGRAQQACLVAQGPAPRAQDAGQQVQRRRQAGHSEAAAVGKAKLQRRAQHGGFRRDAQFAHQAQRGAVGANEDVLSVVQRQTVNGVHSARPAAGDACGLEHGDLVTGTHRVHCAGKAGPACADHRDLHAQLPSRQLTAGPGPERATPAKACATASG